ncbi:MAG: hypothetical protein AAF328_11250 [Planctomycetota bacterium]
MLPKQPSQPDPQDANTSPEQTSGGDDRRALILTKGDQRYVFDCPPGKEADVMNRLALMIDDDENDLTWFDAALICDQLGKRMKDKLQAMRRTA